MFQFTGFPPYTYVFSARWQESLLPGCPIQISAALSVFATPRSFSQLITSFIGSQCQGIRPAPYIAWPNKGMRISNKLADRCSHQIRSIFRNAYDAVIHPGIAEQSTDVSIPYCICSYIELYGPFLITTFPHIWCIALLIHASYVLLHCCFWISNLQLLNRRFVRCLLIGFSD